MSAQMWLVRILFILLMVPVLPAATIAFFAPLLWPFAVFVQTGRIVSLRSFGLSVGVMLLAWVVLFAMYSALIRLNEYFDSEGDGAVVNPAFQAASKDGRHGEAAKILFMKYWSLGLKSFSREAET